MGQKVILVMNSHACNFNVPRVSRMACFLVVGLVGLASLHALAQASAAIGGDYAGVLGGALHVKLHIKADASGTITGTLDSTGVPLLYIRPQ